MNELEAAQDVAACKAAHLRVVLVYTAFVEHLHASLNAILAKMQHVFPPSGAGRCTIEGMAFLPDLPQVDYMQDLEAKFRLHAETVSVMVEELVTWRAAQAKEVLKRA